MKTSTILCFTLLLYACGVARPVLDSDNTKVEVKTVEKIVTDTAYVQIPVIVEKVVTMDTLSLLENKYAKSEAMVSGGVLTHTLETKPGKEPVEVQHKETQRDSTTTRTIIRTRTISVEKKLSPWQQIKLDIGGICIILLILSGLYIILSQTLNLKS